MYIKNIIINIYRIQASDSIIGVYFCIKFISYMLKGISLLDYSNLFPRNKYEKNDKIIDNNFSTKILPTSFSPVTSTNKGVSLKSVLVFSFDSFTTVV